MSHQEVTAKIRTEIKAAGVKARVWKHVSCGTPNISVSVPSYDSEFTPEQIIAVTTIAKQHGLTFVRSSEINPEHESFLTGKKQWNFEYHA